MTLFPGKCIAGFLAGVETRQFYCPFMKCDLSFYREDRNISNKILNKSGSFVLLNQGTSFLLLPYFMCFPNHAILVSRTWSKHTPHQQKTTNKWAKKVKTPMNFQQPEILINSFEQCRTDYKLANKMVIKMKKLHVPWQPKGPWLDRCLSVCGTTQSQIKTVSINTD